MLPFHLKTTIDLRKQIKGDLFSITLLQLKIDFWRFFRQEAEEDVFSDLVTNLQGEKVQKEIFYQSNGNEQF